MRNKGQNTKQVRDFLLGRLPAELRQTVEERLFVDREAFEEMLAEENELVDEYVRDQLSRRDRRALESAYLGTQEHRSKVEMARSLKAYIEPDTQTARAGFPWARPAWAIAITLAFLAGAAALWRNSGRHASQTPPAQISVSSSPAQQPVFKMALTSQLLRDTGAGKSFTIPAGAGEVELQANIELAGFERFDAELRTPEGDLVWGGQDLPLQPQQIVALRVPASRLQPGDYVVSLQARSGGRRVEAGEFAFRVDRARR